MSSEKEMETFKFFVSCDCFSEGVVVTDWAHDEHQPQLGGNIDIALWSYGQNGQAISWKDRIRWCWNILRKGLPFNDQVTLSPEKAKSLGEDLIQRAKKYSKD